MAEKRQYDRKMHSRSNRRWTPRPHHPVNPPRKARPDLEITLPDGRPERVPTGRERFLRRFGELRI